jgi:hypothetical protein
MKRGNTKNDKPKPKVKAQSIGTSILETWWDTNLELQFYTDGYRTLYLIPGGRK